jgi:hypothetical protein
LWLIDKSFNCGNDRIDEELGAAENLDILHLAICPDCKAQVDRASFACDVARGLGKDGGFRVRALIQVILKVGLRGQCSKD